MEYDLHHSVKQQTAVNLAVSAGASTVGNTIDTRGFESLEYIISSGTITAGDFTVLLEEAPDDGTGNPGTFAAVPSELVLGQAEAVFADTDDNTSRRIGSVGKERFQRMTLVGANSPDGQFAASAVLGHPQSRPTDS